ASAAPGPAAENSLLDFDFSLEGKDAAPGADLSQTEPDLSVLDLPAEPARDAAPAAADLAWPDQPGETAPAPAAAAPLPEAELEAAFGEPEAAFAEPAAEPEPEPAPAPGDVTVEAVTVPPSKEDEALATKLDLAQVYLDMGDSEGAREVLHELIGEAKGTLKQRAEEMLADMAA
ncbi:FimV/HubP family polar landmark protein, partial [Paludibacterium sp.]